MTYPWKQSAFQVGMVKSGSLKPKNIVLYPTNNLQHKSVPPEIVTFTSSIGLLDQVSAKSTHNFDLVDQM